MAEIGHFTTLIFIAAIWVILIFVTAVNIYYFSRIYNQGGTPDYNTDSAWTITVLSTFTLLLLIICFFAFIYVFVVEYQRSTKKEQLELKIERYKSAIDAIDRTYDLTSKKLSKDIEVQIEKQLNDVTTIVGKKNFMIKKQTNEIMKRDQYINRLQQYTTNLKTQVDQNNNNEYESDASSVASITTEDDMSSVDEPVKSVRFEMRESPKIETKQLPKIEMQPQKSEEKKEPPKIENKQRQDESFTIIDV